MDYEERVEAWVKNGLEKMPNHEKLRDEAELPGAHELNGGLLVPAWINDRLFSYQRTGVQWMWELHQQYVGGIVGDEMGLGKGLCTNDCCVTLNGNFCREDRPSGCLPWRRYGIEKTQECFGCCSCHNASALASGVGHLGTWFEANTDTQ